MNYIYLDYAATSPLLPSVQKRMEEVLSELTTGNLGNPSSLHAAGQRATAILDDARIAVADLINASPEEIIFTSGGSEANNTVTHIFSGQPIAVSAIEHPSLLNSARAYANPLTIIPVDEYGFLDLSYLRSHFADQDAPALISVMLANNELGTIEPLSEISQLLRQTVPSHQPISQFSGQTTSSQHSISPSSSQSTFGQHSNPTPSTTYLHTDATQAVGKIPVDVKALGVDYLTLSAHKIGGPVGIGALYVRKNAPYKPLIYGGHQENSRRAGTSNALLAAGFAVAAREAKKRLPAYATVAKLRDHLKARILAEVPYSSCNTPDISNASNISPALRNAALPNILNMSFRAAEGEAIQLYLDAAGISVSTGSACAAGDLSPSHVLMATRHDAEVAHSSIRFSLSPETTSADIDYLMSVLPGIIAKLQSMSTIKINPKE